MNRPGTLPHVVTCRSPDSLGTGIRHLCFERDIFAQNVGKESIRLLRRARSSFSMTEFEGHLGLRLSPPAHPDLSQGLPHDSATSSSRPGPQLYPPRRAHMISLYLNHLKLALLHYLLDVLVPPTAMFIGVSRRVVVQYSIEPSVVTAAMLQ